MADVIEMLFAAGSENELDVDQVLHTCADLDSGVVYGVEGDEA